MQDIKIQYQIKAISRQIEEGKCKNVYSAIGKVNKLKNRLKIAQERDRISNWLAQ